jgi:hypothetical protein
MQNQANNEHQAFIDLMKAVGMFLIIYGHVVGDPLNLYNQVTQPVHTKQIGVAFFVFLTGWGLANDTRDPLRTVYNRIFPFFFYGILFSIFISILFYFLKGDTNPSNYLPYMLGINVFLNYFPANPTTWYIGTYLHILLFWLFFMKGRPVKLGHIALAFVVENVVRSIFMYYHQDFIAYMLLPNWLTVFLLGMYLHEQRQRAYSHVVLLLIVGWLLVFAGATYLANSIGFDDEFPFRNIQNGPGYAFILESLGISVTYIVHTLFFFAIARYLPGASLISFFARATLLTVIFHMPIVFDTSHYFYALFESADVARIYFIFTVFIGLAIVAEFIQKMVNIKAIGEYFWQLGLKLIGGKKASNLV